MITKPTLDDAKIVADAIWMLAPLLTYVGYWAGGAWYTRKPMDETTFNCFALVTCGWFFWGWM